MKKIYSTIIIITVALLALGTVLYLIAFKGNKYDTDKIDTTIQATFDQTKIPSENPAFYLSDKELKDNWKIIANAYLDYKFRLPRDWGSFENENNEFSPYIYAYQALGDKNKDHIISISEEGFLEFDETTADQAFYDKYRDGITSGEKDYYTSQFVVFGINKFMRFYIPDTTQKILDKSAQYHYVIKKGDKLIVFKTDKEDDLIGTILTYMDFTKLEPIIRNVDPAKYEDTPVKSVLADVTKDIRFDSCGPLENLQNQDWYTSLGNYQSLGFRAQATTEDPKELLYLADVTDACFSQESNLLIMLTGGYGYSPTIFQFNTETKELSKALIEFTEESLLSGAKFGEIESNVIKLQGSVGDGGIYGETYYDYYVKENKLVRTGGCSTDEKTDGCDIVDEY